MNAQPEQQDSVPGRPDRSAVSKPGDLLRAARELAGLTTMDIASDLHLDLRTVEALEASNFENLGAPVYARGYLSRYARLLGLSDAAVLQAYEACSNRPTVRDPVPVTLGMIPEPRPLLPSWAWRSVAGLVILAIAVTLLQLHTSGELERLAARAVPAAAVTETSPLATLPAADTTRTAEATVAVAQLTLQLKFVRGDSWVEVYDANNQQLFYDQGRNASETSITGAPPLRVVLGSAANVNLTVNGKELQVPTSQIASDVARFVVNADGAIE